MKTTHDFGPGFLKYMLMRGCHTSLSFTENFTGKKYSLTLTKTVFCLITTPLRDAHAPQSAWAWKADCI